MKFKLFALLSFLLVQSVFGANLDSLKTLVFSKGLASSSTKNMLLLSETYLKSNADSALYFANQILNRADLTADEELRAVLVKAKVKYGEDSLIASQYLLLQADDLVKAAKDTYWILNYHMIRAYISELNANMTDAVEQNQLGLQRALSEKDTVYQSRFYNNLGLNYKAIKENEKAIEYLKKAALLFASQKETKFEYSTYLNLGAVYIDLRQFDNALMYLQKAQKFFENNKNYYELATTLGNLANLAYLQSEYNLAIRLLHTKLANLNTAESFTNMPTVHIRCQALEELGRAHLAIENLDSAYYYYHLEDSLASTQVLLHALVGANLGLSKVFEKMGKSDSALAHLKIYITYNDSLVKRENLTAAERMKAEFEMQQAFEAERQIHTNNLFKKEKQNGVLVLLILSLLLVIFLFYGLIQRSKKNEGIKQLEELQLKEENRKLEQSLVSKENQLIAKHIKLSETEGRIENTLKELKVAMISTEGDNEAILQKIAKQIEGKSGKKSIEALDIFLQESDTRLFETLSKKYPNLTRAELRLCAFIRLNLSTKEIAAITHQTANSVKIGRYRLRKKIEIPKNDNLVSYLNRLVSSNT